jgi:hypothetical protein
MGPAPQGTTWALSKWQLMAPRRPQGVEGVAKVLRGTNQPIC